MSGGQSPQFSYAKMGVSAGMPITLGAYKRLSESGAMTRSLTDRPVGTGSAARRANGAAASAAMTRREKAGRAGELAGTRERLQSRGDPRDRPGPLERPGKPGEKWTPAAVRRVKRAG